MFLAKLYIKNQYIFMARLVSQICSNVLVLLVLQICDLPCRLGLLYLPYGSCELVSVRLTTMFEKSPFA